MNETFCPHCGGSSQLLFNLISCVTPDCRNYEESWHRQWAGNNRPNYTHHPWGNEERFLGCFTSDRGSVFDLYRCEDPLGQQVALARFGSGYEHCYYVDEKETEIGLTSSGPVKSVNKCVIAALKTALRRMRKR